MPRSIWKGVITFGIVSIPVRVFGATEDKDVSFHLLHGPDHGRVRYKRWCPVDEREVSADELVKAYEVGKDRYVELTEADLASLPLPSKHSIELAAFVQASEIDPIYYEKSYYVEPDEAGRKAYALLLKVLESKHVTGLAKIALRNKERLCALRPMGGTLVLETLFYPDEIRAREASGPDVLVTDREMSVAGSLVDALAEPFDPTQFRDRYREAVLDLIAAKTQGARVVTAEAEDGASGNVTDLMEALKASVAAARQRKAGRGGDARASAASHAAPPTKRALAGARTSRSKPNVAA